jgi:hypothetical protein
VAAGTWPVVIEKGETWGRTLTLRHRNGPHVVTLDAETAGSFRAEVLGERSP